MTPPLPPSLGLEICTTAPVFVCLLEAVIYLFRLYSLGISHTSVGQLSACIRTPEVNQCKNRRHLGLKFWELRAGSFVPVTLHTKNTYYSRSLRDEASWSLHGIQEVNKKRRRINYVSKLPWKTQVQCLPPPALFLKVSTTSFLGTMVQGPDF